MPDKMNVPKGWRIVKVCDISNLNANTLSEKTDKKISFKYLDLSSIDKGKINFPKETIDFSNLPSRARRILKNNDIIMATVRPNLQSFAYADFYIKNIICSTGFTLISCNNNIEPRYIYQYLYCKNISKQIYGLLVGSNYPAINTSDVENLKILLPPLPEQQKIAKILSTWDKAIETTEKLIQNKKQLKKYLMQKLLTGKIHFKEFKNKKWDKTSLKKILKLQMRPIDKPDKEYKSLGIRSHGKGIFVKLVDNPKSVMMDTLYQVKENDLILNITFAWEGAIAIVAKQHEVGLVSHRFPTFVFDKELMIPEYFKQIIIGERFKYKLGLVSPGGAGRNRVLDKKAFLELKVNIPLDINEQKKIADLLNSLDMEIQVLEKYQSCLNNQKQGLMQKLLTGKTRVEIS